MSQKSDHRHAAHRRHASEQLSFFRPQRRVPNRLLQGNIEIGQLFAKPTNVSGNSAIDRADRSSVPIARRYFDHLSAPREQRHQFAGLRIRQRSSLRLNDFGKMRQYSRRLRPFAGSDFIRGLEQGDKAESLRRVTLTIKVLLTIESSSLRASSDDSTRVLPSLTTYLGPAHRGRWVDFQDGSGGDGNRTAAG